MGKKRSSQQKLTKKAASQNRSTTSSTTESTSDDDFRKTETSDRADVVVQTPTRRKSEPLQLLSDDQQDLFLELLARGASPLMASRQLSLFLSDINETRRVDLEFAHRWKEIEQALSQNVAAALYNSAIKGTVSAQTYYLKMQPPPGWDSEVSRQLLHGDHFEECTDAELVELARTIGANPPPEIAVGTEPPGDENVSGGVPSADPDRK